MFHNDPSHSWLALSLEELISNRWDGGFVTLTLTSSVFGCGPLTIIPSKFLRTSWQSGITLFSYSPQSASIFTKYLIHLQKGWPFLEFQHPKLLKQQSHMDTYHKHCLKRHVDILPKKHGELLVAVQCAKCSMHSCRQYLLACTWNAVAAIANKSPDKH